MSVSVQYENPWFSVVKHDRYHWVVEASGSSAAILPIVNGTHLLLLRIRRAAHKGIQLEIPRGYGNPGESGPACARRELEEETGFCVDESRLQFLGSIKPNSAILATQVGVYLASVYSADLSAERDTEAESLVFVPLVDVAELVRLGAIQDAFTLSALGLWSFHRDFG